MNEDGDEFTPLVSIVVPAYNVERYVAQAIESVLTQTFSRLEAVVVDDGSTDSTGFICDRFATQDERVRVIHQSNAGLGAARNAGLKIARGDYVMFLDADDYFHRQAVEVAVDSAIAAQAEVVCFALKSVPEGSSPAGALDDIPIGTPPAPREISVESIFLETPSACDKLYSRKLFSPTIRYPGRALYEDLRTSPKVLAAAETVVRIPSTLYYYRQRQGSIMRSGGANLERNLEIVSAIEDLQQYFREHPSPSFDRAALEFLAIKHISLYSASRVALLASSNAILDKLHVYMKREFPHALKNRHLSQLSTFQRVRVFLFQVGLFKTLKLAIRVESAYVGWRHRASRDSD